METTSSPSLPFDGYVCFSVYAAGLAFNRVYKRLLRRFGLTYPQYLVLVALREIRRCKVGELGDMLHLDSNTLTPLLKRLEAMKLVARKRDSKDQRIVHVSLTDQGAQLAQELICLPAEIDMASGMSPSFLHALEKNLRTLIAHLRRENERS